MGMIKGLKNHKGELSTKCGVFVNIDYFVLSDNKLVVEVTLEM